MKNTVLKGTKTIFTGLIFVLFFSFGVFAQTKTPNEIKVTKKITQIDDTAFKNLLKPNGKPLLVNFWATWCEPCREEFPDLVKISNDYKDKIDVITISLDFADEINTTVPKFLSEMKSDIPTYLLVSQDESALIASIRKDWTGGLPFTMLYNEKGEMAYFKEGKFKKEVLREEIDRVLPAKTKEPTD